ncbi:MAG TPA: hypothetical protein PKV93_12085 [Fervidobacterium sp.]|nr:hypothetical protein [Fervidobacterium sp.]
MKKTEQGQVLQKVLVERAEQGVAQAQEKAMEFVRRQATKARALAANLENALKWLEDGENMVSVLYSVVNEIQNEFGNIDFTAVAAIVTEHASNASKLRIIEELSQADN